jgi:hypothetical protein
VAALLGGEEAGGGMSFRAQAAALGSEGARKSVILGATGATGSQVYKQLLQHEAWGDVVVVGRRPPAESIAADLGKPQPTFVSLESLDDEQGYASAVQAVGGSHHFFNCIGTTRAIAGSAQKFHDIEVGLSEKVAKLASEAGVKSASVVSAQGAAPDRWLAPMWFHPLFYGKTIGLKERTMTSAGFDRVTIFRPGMLARDDPQNKQDLTHKGGGEKFFVGLLGGLKVELLAKAMINDACAAPPDSKEDPLYISGNGKITAYANFVDQTDSASKM